VRKGAFFFYGTLMDRDLLSAVLGRRIWPHALRPAVLCGYRRSSVRGASYPVVLRQRGASVTGAILCGVGTAETARLCSYEGDGYEIGQALAGQPHHGARRVLVFRPRRGGYTVSSRPWHFPGWRLRHKRSAMKAVAVGWVEQNYETHW
jgi:Gamma-glutamyl cyclotransferase, AIG2-like